MSIPQAPRPRPSAQTTSQKPRTTSILKLQNSSRWTAIPALSKADSEGPDVAQDIIHFNALREAGKEATTLNTPVRTDINTPGNSNWQLSHMLKNIHPPLSIQLQRQLYLGDFQNTELHRFKVFLKKMLKAWIENEHSIMQMRVGQRKNVAGHGPADGSDNEQGDYITEEEAMQYATITLGEEIV
ncbi:hypothetical protein EV426DRAFT_146625 [Tirmania nivea]|nr:hypothetical protein EV426DRAFT_146625 [Tirmania nivea]